MSTGEHEEPEDMELFFNNDINEQSRKQISIDSEIFSEPSSVQVN